MADTSKPSFLADHNREEEEAGKLGVSVKTLRNWRRDGIGPPWAMIAGRIYYPEPLSVKWVREQVQDPARAKSRATAA
jgi:predicted site-specific integrase-resolvase